MEFITGFETSRFMPPHRTDILETSNHLRLFREDLRLISNAGITTLRYAVPWHRIEKKRGKFDWQWMDQAMEALEANGLDPILDLVHHVSIPCWIRQGFAHPDYPGYQVDFALQVADRYPHVTRYTPFNEPLVTIFLAGQQGVWYPFGKNDDTFVRMLVNVGRAICLTCKALRERNPLVEIVHIDTAEAHLASCDVREDVQHFVDFCNNRRFLCDDLILGHLDEMHPMYGYMSRHGYTEDDVTWFEANRARIDVRGLDYYAHSERDYFVGGSTAPSRRPLGFARLAEEYRAHFESIEETPPSLWLTETNIRGYLTDRLTWLKYMVEQCELARIPVFCWFPFIDSTGWGDTLLRVPHTRIDPVGIYILDDERLCRYPSELSETYAQLSCGELTCDDIPAYEFRQPLDRTLEGYRDQIRHWSQMRACG